MTSAASESVSGPTPIQSRQARAAAELVASPTPRDVWRELLAADPDVLVMQSPEWIDALCADAGYVDASRLYETAGGGRFVLPMVRRTGALPKKLAPQASMPHAWGMGGLICERPASENELAAIVADLAACGAVRTHIRPNPIHDDMWKSARQVGAVTIPRRAHVLDLAPGADGIWKAMRSEARRGVRKAEKSGVEIECDSSGRLVPVFYGLLKLSVERWAEQQHEPRALARWRFKRRDPLVKFQRLAEALGDAMQIWIAWKDGVPAAGNVVLHGANVNDTRGAMNKEIARPTSANDLLEWRQIEDACKGGCRWYHLGESGYSRGLSQYKEKWGARPVTYSEYRFERLPLTRADRLMRTTAKRLLRFRDA
jgi:hypothetical protein